MSLQGLATEKYIAMKKKSSHQPDRQSRKESLRNFIDAISKYYRV